MRINFGHELELEESGQTIQQGNNMSVFLVVVLFMRTLKERQFACGTRWRMKEQ